MAETDKHKPTPVAPIRCPHCAHPQLVQIKATELVAVYKCPNCGELIAPVKSIRR